jgi:chromosome segregation ATPase
MGYLKLNSWGVRCITMEAQLVRLPPLIASLANIINAEGVEIRMSTLSAHPVFKDLFRLEETEMLLQTNSSLTVSLKKAQDGLAAAERTASAAAERVNALTAKVAEMAKDLDKVDIAEQNVRILQSEKEKLNEALQSATASGKRREEVLLAELKAMQTKAEGFENELIGLRKAQEDPIAQLLQSNVVASVVSQRDEVLQLRTSNAELAHRVKNLEAKVASYEAQDAELAKKLGNE